MPRVKHAVRSWPLALVIVAVMFGLGHLYEGALGVIQTAMLGIYFSVAFLWRGRLVGIIVAHAGFNIIMFAVVLYLQRLQPLSP